MTTNPPDPPDDRLKKMAELRLTRSAGDALRAESPTLPRSKGSKGSLHSLLSEPPLSPSSTASTSPPARGVLGTALQADARRLSQSYSHASGHGLRAVEEERLARRGSVCGQLERLDEHGEWRPCDGELSGGVFTVRAPTQSPVSDPGRRHSFDTVSDDSDGEEADFVARLDELAVAPGRRGRLVARCALTTVRVVGTAPQHGEQAFRLVLDGGRRHVFMKAQSYDDMCHWLLGFHRSLAAVVARLKRQPPGSPLPFRGRASSADNGSPQSAASDDLHKKSAHRPRRTPPGSPRRPPPPPPLTPPSQDDGEPLYRKSSARTFRTGKYVPPALRGKGSLPVLDDFEEIGEPVVAEWRSQAGLRWRSAVACERGAYAASLIWSPRRDAAVPPSSTRRRLRLTREEFMILAGPESDAPPSTPSPRPHHKTQARAARTRTPSTRARLFSAFTTGTAVRSRRPAVLRCLHAIEARRLQERRSWVVSFSILRPFMLRAGDDVARKCSRELHARFEASDGDAETALRAAFLRLDADYCSAASRNEASPDAGATALALVVEPSQRRIIVANCGDCAAVLCRNGSAVALSKPHSPIPHSEEYERVIQAGGWVTSETDLCVGRLRSMDLEDPEISRSIQDRVRLNEIHRVCGEVAVSRALGDVDFKGWTSSSEREPPCFAYPEGHPRRFSGDLLTAEPEVQVASLGKEHAFVVLATDGLWDVLDGEEAVRVVDGLLKAGKAPAECCAELVARALRLGSGDNVTALVVEFAAAD